METGDNGILSSPAMDILDCYDPSGGTQGCNTYGLVKLPAGSYRDLYNISNREYDPRSGHPVDTGTHIKFPDEKVPLGKQVF